MAKLLYMYKNFMRSNSLAFKFVAHAVLGCLVTSKSNCSCLLFYRSHHTEGEVEVTGDRQRCTMPSMDLLVPVEEIK